MKRKGLVLLLAVFLVVGISSVSLAQVPGYWDIKGAIDLGGEIDIDGIGDDDVDSGFTLVGEYKVPQTTKWTLGAGVQYQLDREIDNSSNRDFNFVPIYALAHYNMQNSPYYFLGHLGYNSFDMDSTGDTSGGMYYAVGAGMDLASNMSAEVMYSVNNGEAEINGSDRDVDYSKLTVSLGYQF
ncbi:outer membrane protein with beta-barrel domain [Halanaerobium saccharolyticum]|uniref:Outer membrane protein with beta-barrel domain n=1 Tax=Halanaerobium saccharolyticum TaxID=43595 RepID=A0A4R7Z7U1_9FIRM|nr:outer membrane beta-barrel protein [Halanaerobium saccharolyticum]RAK08655.1 outer membrane protein with beta-barrel domain [Halanaerobium saccharolyticum]TDW07202.1 outer membrane protein with beta-barrel domain [Halanaerobium saccharolyticum]TDX60207.1 outer membrane protein with beta-barrel domain [Halanaerobium saccharolyticum]